MAVGRRCRYASLALAALLLGFPGVSRFAHADTAPPDASVPATVSAEPLPTTQVDGVVYTQVIVGNTVYAGGRFGTARPAGAAPGVSTVARHNLLAYDIRTGVLLSSFVPDLNGQVLAMAASPDGTRIYVAGEFTTANGVTRNRIAAYSTATGQLLPFAPSLDYRVAALAVSGSTVYAGGGFKVANGSTRTRLAAFSATNGSLLPWAPAADASVLSMVMAPGSTKVVVGGQFATLSGQPAYGMGALDPVTGAVLPWAATNLIRNGGANAAINSLTTDGVKIYGTGYVFGPGGNIEGGFALDPSNGAVVWVQDCHGDQYSSYAAGGVYYTVGHTHYCGNVGGFPETNPRSYSYGLAFTTQATGTVAHNPVGGYYDFGGTPAPTLLHWFPKLDAGTFTGQSQAGWHVTGNGQYVVIGGEFPKAGGVAQQGLVRYAVRSAAPNALGPEIKGAPLNPSVTSLSAGTARIAWQADWDRDNEALTYKLVRESNTAAPVYQTTVRSNFWTRPQMGFIDSGLVAGQTYHYRLYVNDPLGNTVSSENLAVVVSSSPVSPYAQAVLNDGAQTFWRLGEPSGSTAVDWAGFSDGQVGTGVSRGATGAIGGDTNTASTFDGSSLGLVSTKTAQTAVDQFSVETWFRTNSTSGGKIVGYGDQPTAASSNYDRHVYMDNAGHVTFGVYRNGVQALSTTGTYNDGQWHQVVASLSGAGMSLYLDAKQVGRNPSVTAGQPYSGYWRLGGDNLGGWPSAGSSQNFAGDIDEFAFYPATLSAAQISAHFASSGRTPPPSPGVRPTDAYGRAVYDAAPAFYWRLGDASDPVAQDATPNELSGSYSGGHQLGGAGAIAGTADKAVTLDGVDGLVSSTSPVPGPAAYTEELWFKTTTTRGGKLIGFGSSPTGRSGSYDRHIYMFDDGRLRFGTYTGQINVIDTSKSYNDGVWHHLVGTQSGDGMRLYVDGALTGSDPQTGAQAYDGYWRVGGDNTWGGASSDWFQGQVDEAAVYSSALSAGAVLDHFNKGTGAPVNAAPTASFTATTQNLSAAFNASGSSDPEGAALGYAWDFGDGSAGTGVAPQHTYAGGGTFQVTLTVTDDKGATGTTNKAVTATAAPVNAAPTAAFTATTQNLSATFDASGSSDPERAALGYAWDFGDGSAGTGVAPQHTYAVGGGTFQVTLTVTDDKGATGATTKAVTVTNTGPLASDSFGRSVTNGFGTADLGGAWTGAGAAGNFSVTGGAGRMRVPTAGATLAASLGLSETSIDSYVSVALDKSQTGGGTFVSLIGRRVNSSNDYRLRLRFLSDNSVSASLSKVVAGTETPLTQVQVPNLTYAPGEVLQLRLQVTGTAPTTVRAKVWRSGSTEPGAWLVSTTDSTASLQVAGGIGLLAYLSASSTNAPLTVTYDDLRVERP